MLISIQFYSQETKRKIPRKAWAKKYKVSKNKTINIQDYSYPAVNQSSELRVITSYPRSLKY